MGTILDLGAWVNTLISWGNLFCCTVCGHSACRSTTYVFVGDLQPEKGVGDVISQPVSRWTYVSLPDEDTHNPWTARGMQTALVAKILEWGTSPLGDHTLNQPCT